MRLIALLLLLPFVNYAQDLPIEKIFPMKDGHVVYERTYDVDNMSAQQIYDKMHKWAILNQPTKGVSIAEDNQSKIISTTGNYLSLLAMPLSKKDSVKVEWQYWYRIIMMAADNKLEIKINELKVSGANQDQLMSVENYKAYSHSITNYTNKMKAGKKYNTEFYKTLDKSFIEVNKKLEATIAEIKDFVSDSTK